ncbi:proline dehydrogenase family protein [Spirillospora sp. CA-294931]|uniref:proline dehydrogenase family protein n=1 Tax=Spirillospora sp. CA-294931 TaxID=3240042 RepID=UPI003D8E3B97
MSVSPLRSTILAAARSPRLERTIAAAPVSRSVVRRFVAGEDGRAALEATRALVDAGLTVTLDHLGEDTLAEAEAHATAGEYLRLLEALREAGLSGPAEVSLKLSAVGQAFDEKLALGLAQDICAAADAAGTTVTLDMEDHTTTDSTLEILGALRADFPGTGAVLQSYLRRTEGDCRDLAGAGSRVRLCKGAYREPASVAYQAKQEVDASYVRCMGVLMRGEGRPMLATHDPRLIEIALAKGRAAGTFEFQMLYGIRPHEQRRLAAMGHTVRVYIPYGGEWYGYLMRRLAERPANLAFFLRALGSRS